MSHIFETLSFETENKTSLDITSEIKNVIRINSVKNGILILSILHTSCSLLVQENADKSVQEDIRNFLEEIAPERNYIHNSEGPDDMPAHLKTLLTQTHLSLSIMNGKLILGNWQGIFLLEHRINKKTRHVNLHILKE